MDRRAFLIGAAFLTASSSARGAGLKSVQADGDIVVTHDEAPVLRYRGALVPAPPGRGPLFSRSGYLHPVHAPNGAVVTDDFPDDHPHQRGVFFAWTKTAVAGLEPDFWNLGAGKGRIRSTAARLKDRGLAATHAWEMHRGEAWEAVMDETWEVSVVPPRFNDPRAADAAYVFDLTSRQKPRLRIDLPEYRYGGMAVRGARDWMIDRKRLTVLTSEGKNLATADASRARWIDMSGAIGEGLEAGIALLEHPSNLGAPNMLRVPPDHPYSVFSPPKAGPVTLDAGKEYVFRYRLIAHNGPADPVRLETEWKRWVA